MSSAAVDPGRAPDAASRARRRRRDTRLRQRYGILLVALLGSFAVQGIAESGRVQELIVTTLLAATLVLALRAAEADERLILAVVLVGVLLVGAVIASALADGPVRDVSRAADALLVLLAPPAVAFGVIRGMRENGQVTVQAVLGVLCLYLLFGLFFAALYGAIDQLGGQPFFTGGTAATTSNCVYFSFTTLTTIGYGDVTAASQLGHTLAVSEGLLGQVYLVTIVAVLVANLNRPPQPR